MDSKAVSAALDTMLYLNNCGSLWQAKDLSWKEKERIYQEAQRPVLKLMSELQIANEECDGIVDKGSSKFSQSEKKRRAIEKQLSLAKENASNDIYFRMNATGTMARETSEGEIQLDFHGLPVAEAKSKLEDMVVPVLPVLGSLVLITGRGSHSSSGTSALKPALQKYVSRKHKETISWEPMKKNPGAVRLRVKAGTRLD